MSAPPHPAYLPPPAPPRRSPWLWVGLGCGGLALCAVCGLLAVALAALGGLAIPSSRAALPTPTRTTIPIAGAPTATTVAVGGARPSSAPTSGAASRGPRLGTYACGSIGATSTTTRPDLAILSATRYRSVETDGEYSYDPASQQITWRSGALANPDWLGVYYPPSADGNDVPQIRIRDRRDVAAGNARDLQVCNLK